MRHKFVNPWSDEYKVGIVVKGGKKQNSDYREVQKLGPMHKNESERRGVSAIRNPIYPPCLNETWHTNFPKKKIFLQFSPHRIWIIILFEKRNIKVYNMWGKVLTPDPRNPSTKLHNWNQLQKFSEEDKYNQKQQLKLRQQKSKT